MTTRTPFHKFLAPTSGSRGAQEQERSADPSDHDSALERDLARVLERVHAERSPIRRAGLWRVYCAKVRMRSDAQIRRMADADAALERQIDGAYQCLVTATTLADRIVAMESLRALIKSRSGAQVERMERAKGLVRGSLGPSKGVTHGAD